MRQTSSSTWRSASLLLLVPPALSGCGMVVMDPVGDVARHQRDLILASTGLMLLIIVPVLVLTILFAWRYRASNERATYDPDFDHSALLELVIWSCPLLIIICLGALTWTSTHLLDPWRPLKAADGAGPAAAGEPLEVQVVAMDWKWLFIYPRQRVASINELALPVGTPVRFTITSVSQMNTFYAPTLAGMIYAMPGMQTQLHAVLRRPVESWGFSGNYSGAGFSDMRFRLRGLDPAAFDRWLATRAGAGRLDRAAYLKLEAPTERVAPMRFAGVEPALFDLVVNRCVEPGRVCARDVMVRDMARGASLGDEHVRGLPPATATPPSRGGKPEPALAKEPEEKGSGPNVTKPRAPSPPGQQAPGSQRNRDMSARDPLSLPGTTPTSRA